MTKKLKLDTKYAEADEAIVPLFLEGDYYHQLIVATILQDALALGCTISARHGNDDIDDVEESTDLALICKDILNTDSTTLAFHQGQQEIGWVHVMADSRPWTVISDMSIGETVASITARAEKLANFIKDTHIEFEQDRQEAWMARLDAQDSPDYDDMDDPAESFGKAQADAVAGHRGEI